jgi:hypothetical protein
MKDEYTFQPERRLGSLFQAGAIMVFTVAGLMGLWQASRASIGPMFLFYLLPAMAALAIVPMLAYRLYALQNSSFTLARDGIHLRWGLRFEDIPVENVLWVRPAPELGSALPLPRLRWPGSVVGHRHLPDAEQVEFMASNTRSLVVIATPGKGFAISPDDVQAFLEAFQRCSEMGALSPMAARSVYPTVLLARVWADRPGRTLILSEGALSILLLAWISLVVPTRETVPLGFLPDGTPGAGAPTVRLLLLPMLNTIFLLTNLILGLFFFRREESQPFSYLLWSNAVLVTVLFLAATFFILK